jgi:hypothetical protein
VSNPNENADAAMGNGVDPVVLATHVNFTKHQNADRIGHLIFLSFASLIILLSVLMSTDGKQAVFLPGFSSPLPDTCSSRRMLGVDCPGCGLTRAFICISHGQLSKAWKFNHASFIIYLFVAIQLPWHAIQIWRIQKVKAALYWPFIYWIPMAVAIILLTNWIWTLTRFQ